MFTILKYLDVLLVNVRVYKLGFLVTFEITLRVRLLAYFYKCYKRKYMFIFLFMIEFTFCTSYKGYSLTRILKPPHFLRNRSGNRIINGKEETQD